MMNEEEIYMIMVNNKQIEWSDYFGKTSNTWWGKGKK